MRLAVINNVVVTNKEEVNTWGIVLDIALTVIPIIIIVGFFEKYRHSPHNFRLQSLKPA